jgi:hypothetical protein
MGEVGVYTLLLISDLSKINLRELLSFAFVTFFARPKESNQRKDAEIERT